MRRWPRVEALRECLNRLQKDSREQKLIHLRYHEGLTSKQICTASLAEPRLGPGHAAPHHSSTPGLCGREKNRRSMLTHEQVIAYLEEALPPEEAGRCRSRVYRGRRGGGSIDRIGAIRFRVADAPRWSRGTGTP